MDETPQPLETPAEKPVRRSLLTTEILITLPTLVISIALAYFSFVQADASRKMQRTETWPFVSYETGNSSPEGKDVISFSLSNDGVGPARLKEMELLYNGTPMTDAVDFIRSCCAAAARGLKDLSFATESVEGVLRSGEHRDFIKLAKAGDDGPLWYRLNGERWKVVVRTCYCSIFDECWVFDSRKEDPDEVKACPADWTKFKVH